MALAEYLELPFSLRKAHAEGKLVLFAGAGVSMSEPSNLPGFFALAERLGKSARKEEPRDGEDLDSYLEYLDGQGYDVRKGTRRILTEKPSEPNRNHRAIIDIARTGYSPRVITTNFDCLLTQAWEENAGGQGVPHVNVYPSLPRGNDFEGIVQIHGSVEEKPSDFILTKSDFSKGYMGNEGRVTNFLKDVFENFVVLFIGYSHSDPLMRYLHLGLPKRTECFSLIDFEDTPEDREQWRTLESLGITPLPFSRKDNFFELSEKLENWAAYAKLDRIGLREAMVSTLKSLEQGKRSSFYGLIAGEEDFNDFLYALSQLDIQTRLEYVWELRETNLVRSLFCQGDPAFGSQADAFTAEVLADVFCSGDAGLSMFWALVCDYGAKLSKSLSDALTARCRFGSVESQPLTLLAVFLSVGLSSGTSRDLPSVLPTEAHQWQSFSRMMLKKFLMPAIEVKSFGSPKDGYRRHFFFRPNWGLRSVEMPDVLEQAAERGADQIEEIIRAVKEMVLDVEEVLSILQGTKSSGYFSAQVPRFDMDSQQRDEGLLDGLLDFLVGAANLGLSDALLAELENANSLFLQRYALFALGCQQAADSSNLVGRILAKREVLSNDSFADELKAIFDSHFSGVNEETINQTLSALRLRSPRHGSESVAEMVRRYSWLEVLHRVRPENEEIACLLIGLKTKIPPSFLPDRDRQVEIWGYGQSGHEPTLGHKLDGSESDKVVMRDFLRRTSNTGIFFDEVLYVEANALAQQPSLAIRSLSVLSSSPGDTALDRFCSLLLASLEQASELHAEILLNLACNAVGPQLLERLADVIFNCAKDGSAIERTHLLEAIECLLERAKRSYRPIRLYDPKFRMAYAEWPARLMEALILLENREVRSRSGVGRLSTSAIDRFKDLLVDGQNIVPIATIVFCSHLDFFLEVSPNFAREELLPFFAKECAARELAYRGLLQARSLPWSALDFTEVLDLVRGTWDFVVAEDDDRLLSKPLLNVTLGYIKSGSLAADQVEELLLTVSAASQISLSVKLLDRLGKILSEDNLEQNVLRGIVAFIGARLEGEPRELEMEELNSLGSYPLVAPKRVDQFPTIFFERLSTVKIQSCPRTVRISQASPSQQDRIGDFYAQRLTKGIDRQVARNFRAGLRANYRRDPKLPSKVQSLIDDLELFA